MLSYQHRDALKDREVQGVENIEKIFELELPALLGIEKEQRNCQEGEYLTPIRADAEASGADGGCENSEALDVKALEDPRRILDLRRVEERGKDGKHTARKTVIEV